MTTPQTSGREDGPDSTAPTATAHGMLVLDAQGLAPLVRDQGADCTSHFSIVDK